MTTTTKQAMVTEIQTRVPKDHRKALMKIAKERRLNLSDVLREAMREYLARQRACRS